jgi:formylglycine-generating enzyme required for sulfatase activity
MRSLPIVFALFAALPVAAVEFEYVAVRDAGNAPDSSPDRGGVAYEFAISKYEVTVGQYVAFLNEVANEVDTHGLYDASMAGIDFPLVPIGFERLYVALPGFVNKPVSNVTFWDALRFVNWLHNGQPRGLQNSNTTEDGAYHLTPQLITENGVVRNPDAEVFLPSADEWYKAAYYDPIEDDYQTYPTGAALPTCVAPGPASGSANCGNVVGAPVDVGSYPGSPSPYGTFDQGGNVWEWTEEIFIDVERVSMGGSFVFEASALGSNIQSGGFPASAFDSKGFRVATLVPEPAGASLVAGAALAALAARRRIRGPGA